MQRCFSRCITEWKQRPASRGTKGRANRETGHDPVQPGAAPGEFDAATRRDALIAPGISVRRDSPLFPNCNVCQLRFEPANRLWTAPTITLYLYVVCFYRSVSSIFDSRSLRREIYYHAFVTFWILLSSVLNITGIEVSFFENKLANLYSVLESPNKVQPSNPPTSIAQIAMEYGTFCHFLFLLKISSIRFLVSGFRLQASDFRMQVAGFGLQQWNYQQCQNILFSQIRYKLRICTIDETRKYSTRVSSYISIDRKR